MDDVGLGKTVSALAAISHPDFLPAAIVVQAHLAQQWADEYIKAFTRLRPHIIRGTKPYELPPADVYIWRYSNIAGWVDYAAKAPLRSVVFDEVQELRHGTDTAKGRAALAFCGLAARGEHGVMERIDPDTSPRMRIGLTATPIYNYGDEIFNVAEVIEPGALGERWQFNIEWCRPHGTHWVVKDPPALGTYLRELNIAIRRTDEDVGNQMPPVNIITHTVPYDEAEAKKDEDLARSLALKVVGGGSFVEKGQAARELDALLRHTTGVAKARGVAAFVRILLEARQPVLLCGWHREVYDIWLDELKAFGPVLFTGSESQPQKRRAKQAFVQGATNCLIMSLRSGVGLDGLQLRGHTVVFGELDWSPQVHKQVIGRLRRPGQTRQVDAIYLIADGGSDPAIVSTLGLKGSQSAGIVDPLKPVEQQHSDATRIRQLAELYLRGRSDLAHPEHVTPASQPGPRGAQSVQEVLPW
jgi:superfamily II DNA or RNA helicase